MIMQASILLCLALVSQIRANFEELPTVRPAEAACNAYQKGFHNGDDKTTEFKDFNGGKAKPGEFPFIVSLQYNINNQLIHGCSGSLITIQHVLTTAQCINNVNGKIPVQVLLGGVTLNDTSNNIQIKSIGKVIPHPEYRRSLKYYDIGIIELSTPVNITKYVQPICLQYKPRLNSSISTKTSLIAAGWTLNAFYSEEEYPYDLLKTRSLSLIQRPVCVTHYKNLARLIHGMGDSMICMLKESSDFCVGQGVSLLEKHNDSASLVGLASFGMGCGGSSAVPDVYSSIYYHLDWIEMVVWPEKKQEVVQ